MLSLTRQERLVLWFLALTLLVGSVVNYAAKVIRPLEDFLEMREAEHAADPMRPATRATD